MRSRAALHLTAALAVAAMAAPLAGRAETVRPGEPSDVIGLGLIGHDTPDVLKRAKADPYAAPAAPACETIPREIAALDEVLGPDADLPAQKTKVRARANRLIAQALRSAIPHRDVVRFVTGAERRDKALNQAAMAGWARRGFLKGMEVNLGCPGHAGVAEAGAHAPYPVETLALARIAPASAEDPQVSVAASETAGDPQTAPQKTPPHHGVLRSVSSAIVGPVKAFVR